MKRFSFIIALLMVFSSPYVGFAQENDIIDEHLKILSQKSDSLFAVGVDLYNSKKFAEAIEVFRQSDKIDKAILDSTSNRRDYSAMWLASCYYNLGDTVMAASIIPNYYMVSPIDRRLTVQSDSLSAKGMQYAQKGDYTNAVKSFEASAQLEKKVTGESFWYANSLRIISSIHDFLGEYGKAVQYGTEELIIRERTFGKNHSDYAVSLYKLAAYNADAGNYSKAIHLCSESLIIREKLHGKSHLDYVASLRSLASYYSYVCDYNKAIHIALDALEITERLYGKRHPDYASCLFVLAKFYSRLGNYNEAIRLCEESLNIRERLFGNEHYSYAASLNDLALYNSSLA